MARRAFIIDDDRLHLVLVRALLRVRGYEVVVASDVVGISSLDANVDLALVGLQMPDFDGIECLGLLRQRGFCGQLIFIGGADELTRRGASTIAQTFGISLIGMIAKPVTPGKFDELMSHSR